jgi:hypothetical protein
MNQSINRLNPFCQRSLQPAVEHGVPLAPAVWMQSALSEPLAAATTTHERAANVETLSEAGPDRMVPAAAVLAVILTLLLIFLGRW